uniref:RNA dependent RNA polymerase n=1 Tax=Plasmopara viticola lesion associated Partitivirus 9 TaxID=2692007 RepID=A0A6B9Q516_9VIRU|nr:RNA dependent RNA polymerase [Plasmopara viticola lesion associated Partitivirus 9]
MKNLNFLRTLEISSFTSHVREKFAEYQPFRLDWLVNRAKRYFSENEVEKALSNRRSEHNEEALINDFKSFEQPYHPIPKDGHYRRAVACVTKLFDPGRVLLPVTFPDLRYYPWKLKPNAEAPWNIPDFTFTPTFRDLDDESENPKLEERLSRLSNWISERTVTIRQYLNTKYIIGMIDNQFPKFHNLYNEIFQYNRTLVHQIKEGHPAFWKNGVPRTYYWTTLHARSHVVGKDEPDKIRAVFGVTKLLLMIENMFIWPLQATYLNDPDKGRLLWGREMIRGGWKKLFAEIHNSGNPNTYLSLDWSQFDKRLLFELIDEVHSIWRSYFDFSRYQPTSFYPNANPRRPERLERLWQWMCYSIKHTPIRLPNNELWSWNYNGFSSGFQQTQLMDSFANMIMILTSLSALGINIDNKNFWIRVQGDDSLIAFYEQIYLIYGPNFLTSLGDTAMYYFNAKLSVKKSQLSDRLHGMSVLSFFNDFGLPARTDEDLLRHLFFPERNQDLARTASAALGLAYAASGCSPAFHNLCEYIWTKLVKEKGFSPNEESIQWLERAGVFTELDVKAMLSEEFPTLLELRAQVWFHTARSVQERERLWPTEPGPRGRFFFLP